MNAIWVLDGRFTNHLLAQQKLVSRRREGSKVIKRYDQAKTPVERVIASGVLSTQKVASLRKMTRAIRPGDLSRAITDLTQELEQPRAHQGADPDPPSQQGLQHIRPSGGSRRDQGPSFPDIVR